MWNVHNIYIYVISCINICIYLSLFTACQPLIPGPIIFAVRCFMNHFELPPKLSIAFSSMSPKAKVVTKDRKEKQQGYEENREKRRSVSMSEYQLLILSRDRLRMSEEDRNVLYRREEAADTEEGMRMQIEDLQSQLGRSEVMRENLRCQVLRLKLKINTLFSARGEKALMRSER